jgi:YD repeat-containing protein
MLSMRLLATLAVLSLLAVPAVAQEKASNGDRLQQDRSMTDPDEAAMARDLMARTLPFKNGQTLRYYDGDGDLVGTARRSRLTIRFYDPDGNLVGRAERVSQAATNYYDAGGRYLGRRLHKKQTLGTHATAETKDNYDSGAKGFHETTKPQGQPGDDQD